MRLAPILVVDDESEMRTALSHALNRGGFSVESAASGTEALIKLKKDPFSMVITDIKMPEMSGIEVLGAVKKISPQIPVIMITAYGSIHNAVEAMQAGAADYLLKPFSFETLETTVKKVLEGQDFNGNSRSSKQNAKIQSTTKTLVTQDPKLLEILELAQNVASSRSTPRARGRRGCRRTYRCGAVAAPPARRRAGAGRGCQAGRSPHRRSRAAAAALPAIAGRD